ncbi:putative protein phosphatase 2C-like protein 44 isoform X2 [Andrographis paniculata]|uniref:putative protein phosphatase 2C-like protein 44 isoform X2 n=1 Tax=Andrographis paniculata TaxID=175694 RepID=UPI0021E7C8FA|nr:putative protein phosphatase 2C-like protein 44 isoform X2 [Andrographis paniculata]
MTRLKDLRIKLKATTLSKFLIKYGSRRRSGKTENAKKRAKWLNHVSHGYHAVPSPKEQYTHGDSVISDVSDSVVVQREGSQQCELWFFGVFDHTHLSNAITNYLHSNFFQNLPPQPLMEKQGKEAMKRAHQSAISNLHGVNQEEEEALYPTTGSASAMVINGEKLVMANMGACRAVVCRDGEAYGIGATKFWPKTSHWSLEFISGFLRVSKDYKNGNPSRSSQLMIGSERIDPEIEFVILASAGIWECR